MEREVIGLQTERLLLRTWRDEDREPFAALNADPGVMEFFARPLDRAESDEMADRIEQGFIGLGFGLWAVERATSHGEGEFIGFVGLSVPGFEADFTPCVEVGWRLARSAWGHGFASEAASAAIADGFERVGLGEIVSFTAEVNERSQAVMRRIGMTHDPVEDFDHPNLPSGDRLSRHVLYRISSPRPPTP
jgi:RimJ/RimL family protein N-acetyltransferase